TGRLQVRNSTGQQSQSFSETLRAPAQPLFTALIPRGCAAEFGLCGPAPHKCMESRFGNR
ncbi:MAG TPA: hypothetical protein DCG12_16210, partial [Planctomycetaceae bacterium]|nr:hypothetical protein [Planctomycetaceae bacterium]